MQVQPRVPKTEQNCVHCSGQTAGDNVTVSLGSCACYTHRRGEWTVVPGAPTGMNVGENECGDCCQGPWARPPHRVRAEAAWEQHEMPSTWRPG